jgi:beta-ribofuranosylaminobenzene 5'-phosphate synthase
LHFHSGLGVGTALLLGCIEALFLVNQVNIKSEELTPLSSRGGTSGIGINSYFLGGMILDLGKKNDSTSHKPSSVQSFPDEPLLLKRINFPDWELGLILPPSKSLNHKEGEVKFFQAHTPISKEDAYESCYLSFFGAFASVMENDYEGFCLSITKIQKTYWKSKEIANQSKETINLLNRLQLTGTCYAGMSSMGPGLYILTDDPKLLFENLNLHSNYKYINLKACNSGRRISFV